MVKAFARRSEGELLANRCMTTWAGQARFLSEPHASRVNGTVSVATIPWRFTYLCWNMPKYPEFELSNDWATKPSSAKDK